MSKFNTAAASKFATKPIAAATKAPRAPRVVKAEPITAEPTLAAQIEEDFEPLFIMPTSARMLIATVAGLFAYAGSMYWAMQAVNYMVIASLVYTGSSFLAFVLLVTGWFFAIVGSLRLGWRVAKFILGYQSGDIASAAQALRTKAATKVSPVRGWFTRSDFQAEHAEAHYAGVQS
jgi:hypothetical protein